MKLRIVSGELKGRTLVVHGSVDRFRPTQEKVRAAVADSLGAAVRDARVADICAGSGAMGFELLSRGAAHCLFVERHRMRARAVAEQANTFGAAQRCTVRAWPALRFVKQSAERFDIMFFDPPYCCGDYCRYVEPMLSMLSANGILVVERAGSSIPCSVAGFQHSLRRYGDTVIDYYHHQG